LPKTGRQIFGRLECVGHSFAYVAHFVVFRDSNPESCRSKQARDQLSHLFPKNEYFVLITKGKVAALNSLNKTAAVSAISIYLLL
jgi:hypothetical protein